MDYKIVFLDVNGTLTHHEDGSISASTKAAIRSLLSKDIHVVAATGRPLSMCKEIRELGIHTFITANGGYVKHNHEVIHKVTMDPQTVQSVYEFAQTEQHGLSFYTEDFCMNGVKNPDIMTALKETLSLTDYPSINRFIYQEEIYLLCLFAKDSHVEKYIQRFPHLTFKRWHPFVLNVLQDDVSKSLAIKKVLEFFAVEPKDAIAFGDGENDIDMLELAGLGIAMGNGSEKLKETADFVTKNSNDNGIEYALKKFGVI